MSYSSLQEALDMQFQQAKMYNRAGTLVSLSLDTVQSAQNDVNSAVVLAASLADTSGTRHIAILRVGCIERSPVGNRA
jgi:hypothetical protein